MTSRRWLNKAGLGAGLIALIGVAISYAGYGYGIGTFDHMGSGFVPLAVGVAMMGVGLLLGVAAVLAPDGEDDSSGHGNLTGLPDLRGGLCIVGGVAAFVILGDHGGLVPATFAAVFISALGDRRNSVRDALLLSCAMVILALLVFTWALGVQMPAFGWR